jgi:hypothetical protein
MFGVPLRFPVPGLNPTLLGIVPLTNRPGVGKPVLRVKGSLPKDRKIGR